MAAKRHIHDTTIAELSEPKRTRPNDDVTVEHGKTAESEEFDDECFVSNGDSPKISNKPKQNVDVFSEKQPESEILVVSLPVIGIDDADDDGFEVIEADAEIEDASVSAPCTQQQKGNSGYAGCVSSPNPKSHADSSAGSSDNTAQPPPGTPSTSSSKGERGATQKDAASSGENVGPEKGLESSSGSSSDAAPSSLAQTDIVQVLVESSYRSLKVQNLALSLGRPTPTLLSSDTITDPKSGITISLSKYTYQKIPWLTGSKTLRKYLCWPCLLFAPTEKWSVPGDVGWKESSIAILNHQMSLGHVKAFKTLKQMEESLEKIEPTSSPAPAKIPDGNSKDRRFFELLIRIICSKKTRLQNTDMDFDGYEDLMKLVISHDPELSAYYKKQFSKDSLADFISLHAAKLLTSVVSVIKSPIKKELASTPYLTIIYEATENVVDTVSVVAVIVRYVNDEGEIRERFLKFVKLVGSRTGANIGEIHTALVNELGLQKKLIGFSCSGTVVVPSAVGALNSAVKSLSPSSKYFHSPDHTLKELLLQSLSHVEQCRAFFHVVADLETFFSSNPGAIPTLVNFVKTSDPECQWLENVHSFTHSLVSTLKYSYPLVLQFFERVSKRFWNDEVVRQAPEFVKFLTKPKNKFLIALVAKVMSCVDQLSCAMEKQFKCHVFKCGAVSALSRLKTVKASGVEPFISTACDPKLYTNDSKVIHPELPITVCSELFDSIIDTAIDCVSHRAIYLDTFYMGNPSAGFDAVIKDSTVMTRYAAVVKDDDVTTRSAVTEIAILRLQIDSFKAYELMFHQKTLAEHVALMTSLGMAEGFAELHKFLKFSLLVAPPKQSSDSTISRLKAYVKDKQRLSTSDVFLYLEKDYISRLMKDDRFFDDVINHYAKNNNVVISYENEAPIKH